MDFYYVIYEYFDETLDKFIENYSKKHSVVPVNFINKILTQLNFCLKRMHEIGYYHKDIKIGNIYIIYTTEEKNNFDIKLGGFN